MKRKILFIIFVLSLFCINTSYALNLSRVKTWNASDILTAADLNAEYNNILNHSLTNNDVDAAAAIVASKLDQSVAGAIGGTTPNTGAFTTLSASSTLGITGLSTFTGKGYFKDRIYFTQADEAEYIDSLADGYIDYEAGTGMRFRIGGTEEWNFYDGAIVPTTDNDVDLGSASFEWKDLYLDGTANIDAVAADKVTTPSVHLTETTDRTTAVSEGALYTKDSGGQPELFYREESDGDIIQITKGGELNIRETIFSFALNSDATGAQRGIYSGTSLVPTSFTGNYEFWVWGSTTFTTVLRSRFEKTTGTETVTIHALIWQDAAAGGNQARIQVDIGGQTGTTTGTANQVTPEWVEFTVDVSSLSDGTDYLVQVQLKIDGGNNATYLSSIIGISN